MNFLKKIFGVKPDHSASQNPHYIVITLNERIQPFDRGEYYEDPLDEFLKTNNLGEISGGGTMQDADGEIEFVDIEVELAPDVDTNTAVQKIMNFLKTKKIPKNSKLTIETTNEVIEFGDNEGLAIYLDGVNLEPEVYQNSDSNFVVSEIKRLIGDKDETVRFWEFPEKTALYFYGASFVEMNKLIEPFVSTYPLCKNAEIKQIS